MSYIKRDIEKEALNLNKGFPVLTITGPRQSGKTTLARHLFQSLPYFNFENPDIRQFATNDPRGFLSGIKDGAILDEFQHVPDLISYLQQMVDENRKKLRFILTGSNHFSVMNKVSQSLAGRTAVLKLLPFSLHELRRRITGLSSDEIIVRGFYPQIFAGDTEPLKFYRNYYETYLQKDLRQLIQVSDLNLFDKFIRLCAGRIGNILNISSLSNDTGLSVPAIRHWLSVLGASFVLVLLPPFYENVSKRLIKSPKIYFYDTGLASYLLGIETCDQVFRDPLRGALFENMVIMEIFKQQYNQGLDPSVFFYRDSHHTEVDLVIRKGHELIPVEIKSSKTFNPDFLKGLNHFERLFGKRIPEKWLLYDGEQEMTGQVKIVNWKSFTMNV